MATTLSACCNAPTGTRAGTPGNVQGITHVTYCT